MLRTGRKWKVEEAVNKAKNRLQMQKMQGVVYQGKLGTGYGVKRFPCKGSSAQQERRDIGDVIKKGEDEKLYVRAVQQGL